MYVETSCYLTCSHKWLCTNGLACARLFSCVLLALHIICLVVCDVSKFPPTGRPGFFLHKLPLFMPGQLKRQIRRVITRIYSHEMYFCFMLQSWETLQKRGLGYGLESHQEMGLNISLASSSRGAEVSSVKWV